MPRRRSTRHQDRHGSSTISSKFAAKNDPQRAAIATELHCDGAGRYPSELEAAVYFCCLEALQNAAKYAGAGAKVRIDLAEQARRLVFEVADDDRGYDTAAALAGVGVQNMTDRIGALGGQLTIRSAPGSGTKISGSLPWSAENGASLPEPFQW